MTPILRCCLIGFLGAACWAFIFAMFGWEPGVTVCLALMAGTVVAGVGGEIVHRGFDFREKRRLAQPFPPPKRAKYVLCPGPVVSRADGQLHQIGSRQLADLYRVPMEDCIVKQQGDREDDPRFRDLPRLRPRADGDYNWITW